MRPVLLTLYWVSLVAFAVVGLRQVASPGLLAVVSIVWLLGGLGLADRVRS